jgi:hypothetical protein
MPRPDDRTDEQTPVPAPLDEEPQSGPVTPHDLPPEPPEDPELQREAAEPVPNPGPG